MDAPERVASVALKGIDSPLLVSRRKLNLPLGLVVKEPNWTSSAPGVDGSFAQRLYSVEAPRRRAFPLNQDRSGRAFFRGMCFTLIRKKASVTGAPTGAVIVVLPPEGRLRGEVTTLLDSRVTAPLSASAFPTRLEPVTRVMLANARMFPVKAVPEPSVAELPTCQYTRDLSQLAPPRITLTDAPLAVVSVLAIWMTKSAPASPCASRTRSPVNWAELLNL